MSKFKVDDKVVCVNDKGWTKGYVVNGGVYTVVDKHYELCLHDQVSITCVNGPFGSDFKLYKEEKDQVKFDMKISPWFIRFSSAEEAALVDEWLEENFGETLDFYRGGILGVTNTDNAGNISDCYLYYLDGDALPKTKRHEIKLNFKTIVGSVEWPSVKSEKDLKIEELEKTIAEAQKQLKELKEIK